VCGKKSFTGAYSSYIHVAEVLLASEATSTFSAFGRRERWIRLLNCSVVTVAEMRR